MVASAPPRAPSRNKILQVGTGRTGPCLGDDGPSGSPSAEPSEVNGDVHVSTLRELVGEELRKVLREELQLPAAQGASGLQPLKELVDRVASPPAQLPSDGPPGAGWLEVPARAPPQAEGAETAASAPPASPGSLSFMVITDLDSEDADGVSSKPNGTSAIVDDASPAEVLARIAPCAAGLFWRCEVMFGKLGTSEAPPRFDPVSLAVDSRAFSIVVYSMILLNCVFMVHAANEEIDRYSSGPSEFVVIVELIFQALYTIECIVKLWRFRLYYFYDSNWKYNWLDFSLLLMGVYYNFFENLLPNLTWLRMLRMLKLAKALRVIRLIAMVKPLRAILKSLASTIGTLGWSVVMLSGILFLFALIFVLRVASYLEEQELDGSLDPQVRDGLLQTYGSVETTMRNLYICSTGGDDWIACFDPLLPTGAVNQWVFLGFVAFTQIAVLNIILGIFVDEAMRSMLAETSERAREHAEELLQTERELRALCVEADTDGNGKLTQGEWLMAVKTSRLKNYLHMLDFRSSEVKDLVDSMCEQSPDGAVDIDAFVRACMRCRGAASRFDVQHVLRSIEGLRQSLRASGIDGRFTPPDASTAICR